MFKKILVLGLVTIFLCVLVVIFLKRPADLVDGTASSKLGLDSASSEISMPIEHSENNENPAVKNSGREKLYRMIQAHASLTGPEVADPDSAENQRNLQRMILNLTTED